MKRRLRERPPTTGNRTSQEVVVSAISIIRTTIATGAETSPDRGV
jgi:hypothetical protein